MSAWYVFGALGMYPEIPGTGVLALGSPLFPHTTVSLSRGRLVIDARGAADQTPYVNGLTVSGRCWSQPWLRYADIAHGARLEYRLSSAPDPSWGADPRAAPPSFAPASAATGSTLSRRRAG